LDSHEQALELAHLALGKKAEDLVILDLRRTSVGTDFFLICSGQSETHVRAIVDEIVEARKRLKRRVWRVEGYGAGRWGLLDFVDVVVHVFHRETREYFALEDLWGDVPSERISEGGERP
jgi:ribosome-associated protein